MARGPVKYNPAFLTEDELVRSFVVRQADLKRITEVIRQNTGPSNQHVLVVGPRGFGKTTLALRVVAEIRRSEELRTRWYPLVFAEESYQVTTPGEFWLEALFHLGLKPGMERWKQAFEELHDERNEDVLRERALAQLMDFADGEGKRLLLVVENFNMLIGAQISEDQAWKLRHTLLNEPRIMLLATATKRFEQIERADKPMFDLFMPHDLRPLDEEESRALWVATTGSEPPDERVRPIQILTGGNPRLLMIIASFGAGLSFGQLLDDLMQLVDDHTESFKSHLDSLAAAARKVYLALAQLGDPAPARDVARAARMEVGEVSSLLGRLKKRGAVSVVEQPGRTKWYRVAERMYNIYYLMRRRGAPSRRVRAVVNFMVSFYGPNDLVKAARLIGEEAAALPAARRQDHLHALMGIIDSERTESCRNELLHALQPCVLDLPDVPETLRRLVKGVKESGTVTPERSAALDLFKKADEHFKADRPEEAAEVCRKAIELAPDDASWQVLLGLCLLKQDHRNPEAEAAFRRAIDIQPGSAWAWECLSLTLSFDVERTAQAEEAARKALELEPDDGDYWVGLGNLIARDPQRTDEAEQAYRKAADAQPDSPEAWGALAAFLRDRSERYEEAEDAFRRALELDPGNARTWLGLGILLGERLERYEEAESACLRSLDLDPELVRAWVLLGFVRERHLGQFEGAAHAYRKALDLDPNAYGWACLGILVEKHLDRPHEAREAYEKATEMDKDNWLASLLLARLLLRETDEEVKGMKLAEDWVAGHPDHPEALNGFAWILCELGKKASLSQAESWSRRSLELAPDNCQYQHTYATILLAQGRTDEVLEHARLCVQDPEVVSKTTDDTIDLFVGLAAAGREREALDVLRNSPSAEVLEPLVVGLRLLVGEDVKTAPEVLEVAKDVVERVKARRDKP